MDDMFMHKKTILPSMSGTQESRSQRGMAIPETSYMEPEFVRRSPNAAAAAIVNNSDSWAPDPADFDVFPEPNSGLSPHHHHHHHPHEIDSTFL